MARTDVVIPEILESEFYRMSAEKTEVFNTASQGTIVLRDEPSVQAAGGEYTEPVRFVVNGDIETRMDHESSGNATFEKLTQTSGKAVRLLRKLAVQINDDEVKVSKNNAAEWNTNAATQMAENRAIALRNLAYKAVIAATQSMDTPSADYHMTGSRVALGGTAVPITHARLNTLMSKMYDAREKIITLAMNSIIYTDLVGASIALTSLDTVAGSVLYGQSPASLGKPVLVADVSDLTNAADSTYMADYFVLGLGAGAVTCRIVDSDPLEIERDIVSEVKNTKLRQDYIVEIAVAGMKWAPASTTENPTAAQVATAASWDENLDDHRDFPVVMGRFQQST